MAEEVMQEQEQQQSAESAAQTAETEQSAASAPAETAETQSEPAQQDGGSAKTEGGKSRSGGVQRKIDELTRKAYLAEAEAKFYRDLAQKKALGETTAPAKTDAKPAAEPNAADFETAEEYFKAVRAYDREQIKAEVKAELEQFGKKQTAQTEAETRQAEWAEKEAAAKTSRSDYAEVTQAAIASLGAAQGPAVSAIAHAIQFAERGPELLYHLGQHPEELEQIVSLHPTQAVIALGRLEARLTTDKPDGGKALPHTGAPKPPTPIRKASPGPTPKPDDPESDKGMSDDEWLKARQRQVRERSR